VCTSSTTGVNGDENGVYNFWTSRIAVDAAISWAWEEAGVNGLIG